ncbi:MAG: hypothetical protein JW891_02800 [Candidatus Lokiarchaeota archaeon]|nr:hypothetical protein [Candidatus Lokiarchaeota archaeon]
MQNKHHLYILFANILWGLIPVVVSDIFSEVSVLTVIFFRFFTCGIVFLIIAFGLLLINNRYTSKRRIPIKIFIDVLKTRNNLFRNFKNILYFGILGFLGIVMQIIFYFLALKLTSIGFVMIGFIVSTVLMAAYQHGKSESLDVFKLMYLSLLIVSILIIIYVKTSESSNLSFIGLVYVIGFGVCLLFFHIYINRDPLAIDELKIISDNRNYKVIRLMFKLSFMFLLGIAGMFLFLLLMLLIPVEPILVSEIHLFFAQLADASIYFRWEILFIIIFSTILPYILIFIAYSFWSPYNLTYNQWTSIITVVEPMTALFFGAIFINEYFPTELLVITLFLLALSIILRYIHERSVKVNACVLLDIKEGCMEDLPLKLLGFSGITRIDMLVGKYDMILTVIKSSIKDFYYLNEQLQNLEEIKKTTILFINKVSKINA